MVDYSLLILFWMQFLNILLDTLKPIAVYKAPAIEPTGIAGLNCIIFTTDYGTNDHGPTIYKHDPLIH